jgi:octaprenyl-diphosphate synthase
MAFQIKDDLSIIQRKLLGNLLDRYKEQKMTLPLIHVLNTCTKEKKAG